MTIEGKNKFANIAIAILLIILSAFLGNLFEKTKWFGAIMLIFQVVFYASSKCITKRPTLFVNGSFLLLFSGASIMHFIMHKPAKIVYDSEVTVIIYIALLVFSFLVFCIVQRIDFLDRENSMLHDRIEAFGEAGITPVEKLLESWAKYNGSVAVGNLSNLKTTHGCQLLNEYLSSNDTKTLYLVIPKASLKFLREIYDGLTDDALLDKIRIITIEPFVLIQGLLIIGDFSEDEKSIEVKGYLKYKPVVSSGKNMVEAGIYVDLSDNTEEKFPAQLKNSLKYMFDILKQKRYIHNQYVVRQFYARSKGAKPAAYPHQLTMKNNLACYYCDSARCNECPIYEFETSNGQMIKNYVEEQDLNYYAKDYETSDSLLPR